jgi:prolyl-tRNA synthetase
MRQSQLLGKTLREDPHDAQTAAQRLMLRAAYIKQLAAGIYSYLPLAFNVLQKIAQIIREEMNQAGCQELLRPALQPKELWTESKRWERYTDIDGIMFAFKDRRDGMLCLGPTHEEVITSIMRNEINSYKDLPKFFTKFKLNLEMRLGHALAWCAHANF